MLTKETVTKEINMVKGMQMDKLAEFHRKLYKEPILRLLFLELTLRCNEHCFHCGSRCSSDSIDGMPLEKYLEVLRRFCYNEADVICDYSALYDPVSDLAKMPVCLTDSKHDYRVFRARSVSGC